MKRDIFEKDGSHKKGYSEEEDEIIEEEDNKTERHLAECLDCFNEQERLLVGNLVSTSLPSNSTTKNASTTIVKSNNTTNSLNSNSSSNVNTITNNTSIQKENTNAHIKPGDVIIKSPNQIIYFSLNEILLFASVISATDAVAALAFVNEQNDPKLFPILFGEGVVNDAVCIVLYQIIKGFLDSGAGKQT